VRDRPTISHGGEGWWAFPLQGLALTPPVWAASDLGLANRRRD